MSRPLDSRDAILAAARGALEAGGGQIEMNDVARRAGVSVGLAYHYFGSKAGLVSALVTDFYDRYDAVVNRRYDDTGGWGARERKRLTEAVRFLFSDTVAPVMLSRLSASAEVVAVEAERRAAIISLGVANIREGQTRGDVPAHVDAEMASAFLNGGIRQAIAAALSAADAPDADAFAEKAWGFVARALAMETD